MHILVPSGLPPPPKWRQVYARHSKVPPAPPQPIAPSSLLLRDLVAANPDSLPISHHQGIQTFTTSHPIAKFVSYDSFMLLPPLSLLSSFLKLFTSPCLFLSDGQLWRRRCLFYMLMRLGNWSLSLLES